MTFPADKETQVLRATGQTILENFFNDFANLLNRMQDALGYNITMGEVDLKAFLDILNGLKHTQNTDDKLLKNNGTLQVDDTTQINTNNMNVLSLISSALGCRLSWQDLAEIDADTDNNNFFIKAINAWVDTATLYIRYWNKMKVGCNINQDDGYDAKLGELKIKYYEQDAEPGIGSDGYMAMWKDTNDSNRIYLVFKRGEADQVKVELT